MTENSAIDALHEIGSSIAAADPLQRRARARGGVRLHRRRRATPASSTCSRARTWCCAPRRRRTPTSSDRLKLRMGEGITGWVAEHRQPVAVGRRAWEDPRFQTFNELPEDRYDAFLSVPVLSRGKLVGVINVQHREPHEHGRREIQLISTLGFIVGAEIEMARLEVENVRADRAARDAQGGGPRQGHPAARPRPDAKKRRTSPSSARAGSGGSPRRRLPRPSSSATNCAR